MMRFVRHALTILVLAALPAVALALDMDYYTYDGFAEVTNAFRRIALVFNHNEYVVLFAVACVLGLFIGGTLAYGKALVGMQFNNGVNLTWLATVLLGVLFFKGLITPQGTLHVYDPVRNSYEAVEDIPDFIILVAGMTNKAERIIQEIVDDASANPYANEGGGVSFELLMNATTDNSFSSDYFLQKSIRQYYKDCAPLALVMPSYGTDINKIKSDTDDLMSELEEMRSPSVFTTYYSSTEKAGTMLSCQDAFDDHISPLLLTPTTFEEFLHTTCRKSGFDPGSAAELAQCQTKVANLNSTVFDNVGGTAPQLLRNIVIANAISQVMLDENPDAGIRAMTNRAMVSDGIGIAVAANDWMPKIRASVIAIVLGFLPFLVLLVVTPVFPKALLLIVGLLGWITLWGIADVIISQIASDQAFDAMNEIRRHKMGVTAMFLAPEASMKALALFGKARGMGIMISAFLAAALFKLSAYGMTSMAGNWSGQVDSKGVEAADRTQSPTENAKALEELSGSVSTSRTIGEYGWYAHAETGTYHKSQTLSQSQQEMQGLSTMGYDTPHSQANASVSAQAGQNVGTVQGVSESLGDGPRSPSELMGAMQNTSRIEAQGRQGTAAGKEKAAAAQELSPYAFDAHNTYRQNSQNFSENRLMSSIAEEIRNESSNSDMSVADMWAGLATARNSNFAGTMAAYQHDPEEMTKLAGLSATLTQGQFDGMLDVLDRHDLKPSELGRIEGQMRAVNASGDRIALDAISPEEMAIGQAMQGIRKGTDGMATANEAGNRGQTWTDYQRDQSTISAASAAGNLDKFSVFASATDTDLRNVVLKQQLAESGSFSMSYDDMVRAHDNQGWFTDKQMELMPEGGRVTLALNENGDILFSSALAGNNARVENYSSVDQSESYTDTSSIAVGDTYGAGTAKHLLLEDSRQDLLAQKLKAWDGAANEANRIAFFEDATSTLVNVADTEVSKDATLSGGWQLEAGAKLPIVGGASVNTTGTLTARDVDSYSATRQIVEDAYTTSRDEAERALHLKEIDPHSEAGKELFYSEWSSRFQDRYTTSYNTYQELAEDSSKLTDMAQRAKADPTDGPAR